MADDNLRNLFDRTSRSVPATQIERRVQKLGWFIAAGYRLGEEIDSVTMLNFFSELVDEEHTMSESRFNSLWSASTAMKLKESRTNRGLITSDAPVYRACKAGKKCLRFEKRKPAPAKGNGE